MTTVINLFGQPSSGKSTTAADIFAKLKMNDISAEVTYEYAKKYAWKKIPIGDYDQYYLFAKELNNLTTLIGKVDFIICDSPLLLAGYYMKRKTGSPYLAEMCNLVYKDLQKDGIVFKNFYLPKLKKYSPEGRYETEEQADEIGKELLELLDKSNIDYTVVKSKDSLRSDYILKTCGINIQ